MFVILIETIFAILKGSFVCLSKSTTEYHVKRAFCLSFQQEPNYMSSNRHFVCHSKKDQLYVKLKWYCICHSERDQLYVMFKRHFCILKRTNSHVKRTCGFVILKRINCLSC